RLENIPLPKGYKPFDLLDRRVVCDAVVKRWNFVDDPYETLPPLLDSDAQYIVVRSVRPFGTRDRPKESFDKYVAAMKSLKPVADIESRVDTFRQTHFQNKRVVGVHYRSWVLTADIISFKNANKDIFVEKMQEALGDDPNTIFYVASDNLDIANSFAHRFPSKVARFPLFSVERGTLDDIKNSVIEWILLGDTDYIIGTFLSTFSASAAMRTKEIRAIMIGPSSASNVKGDLFCFDKNGFVDQKVWNINGPCPAYYPK
ncbi:MAG TPA: hypothetical protein VEL47_03345, partial [Myxococcota bacterium]|nr:hypothetical protein [Myxococcota bacterium]